MEAGYHGRGGSLRSFSLSLVSRFCVIVERNDPLNCGSRTLARGKFFFFFFFFIFKRIKFHLSKKRERERERSVKDHRSPFREFAIIFSDRKLARIWAEKTRQSDEINAPPSFHRLLSLEVSNAEGYPSQPFFFGSNLIPAATREGEFSSFSWWRGKGGESRPSKTLNFDLAKERRERSNFSSLRHYWISSTV